MSHRCNLLSDSYVTTVAGTLDEFGIPGSALCLEITEGVVVLDFETTRNALAGLNDVGVHVAIDDFGTGFSGFTHLKSLPIDIVKMASLLAKRFIPVQLEEA
jgi:EAL domain-containing protein (putative c-di-GMP-specific phosphodiesterase class I)